MFSVSVFFGSCQRGKLLLYDQFCCFFDQFRKGYGNGYYFLVRLHKSHMKKGIRRLIFVVMGVIIYVK